jgi:hypothetical protein
MLRERDRLHRSCSRDHGPIPVYERAHETAREALLANVGSGVLASGERGIGVRGSAPPGRPRTGSTAGIATVPQIWLGRTPGCARHVAPGPHEYLR